MWGTGNNNTHKCNVIFAPVLQQPSNASYSGITSKLHRDLNVPQHFQFVSPKKAVLSGVLLKAGTKQALELSVARVEDK